MLRLRHVVQPLLLFTPTMAIDVGKEYRTPVLTENEANFGMEI